MKYNRTFHLPWSEGATKEDKISKDTSHLINIPIVITEKMDGSCVSLERDNCFARTHSGPPTHPSFDTLKSFHSTIKYQIPDNIQLFCEYLFAKHSIHYNQLSSYYLLFNIRNTESMMWYSWSDLESMAISLNLQTAPVLFNGAVKSEKELKKLTQSFMNKPSVFGPEREGVVVRSSDGFSDDKFSKLVAKLVRKKSCNY